MTSTEARNANKAAKRPERPYGGVLCSACSRRTIINKIRDAARQMHSLPEPDEGDIQ